MRKIVTAFISFLILIIIMISLVIAFKPEFSIKDENKIQIVATLFPQYDFAKQIVGDKADVTLLVGAGVETHNFEPTAQDMVTMLDNTDMFLYTGTFLEPWTEDIVETLEESNCKIVDVSDNIELIKIEDFESRHINSEIETEEHNHDEVANNEEENHAHNNHEHDENHVHSEDEHTHTESCEHQDMYDGHIWQNLDNAIIMIENILEAICEIDPENAEYYKQNADNYKKEIEKLDTEIEEIVENSVRKEIAVGGEFAYAYFVEQYGLKFVSVYTNCGHGEDPSIAKVKSVIDYINKHEMPVVYYEELSEGTVAKMISEETNAEPLVLYSIHNGNPEKDTYVSLMRKNIESLKQGLK
ncbi:MAG: zinc ABC transporter substrate-binding protein [Clostridia bacterium]|nr:zinc ABC transporter substrate-binding protein [Clostridia bacterium]